MAEKVKRSKTKYTSIYFNENTKKYDVKYNFKEYDVKTAKTSIVQNGHITSILLRKQNKHWLNYRLVEQRLQIRMLPLRELLSYGKFVHRRMILVLLQ